MSVSVYMIAAFGVVGLGILFFGLWLIQDEKKLCSVLSEIATRIDSSEKDQGSRQK